MKLRIKLSKLEADYLNELRAALDHEGQKFSHEELLVRCAMIYMLQLESRAKKELEQNASQETNSEGITPGTLESSDSNSSSSSES
jgi:hypothetical protein